MNILSYEYNTEYYDIFWINRIRFYHEGYKLIVFSKKEIISSETIEILQYK